MNREFALAIIIILSLSAFSSIAYFDGVTVGTPLTANIIATNVNASINLNNPGGEAFWNQITGASIPLTASNSFGGATKTLTLKMANNGTHILVFASWADPTQSITKNNVIENSSFPGLFYANSTFYYEDRIAIWWSLDNQPGPPPCMQKSAYGHGEGESLAGTGNIWHWKAARTDSGGTAYGQLKYGSGPNKGQPLIPPHSYADNEYINTTGHYQLGWDQYPTATTPGNFTIGYGENYIPYNTFEVSAHGVYNSTAKVWNWVAARSLYTTPTRNTIQLTPGQTYYLAVAVFDGGPIPIPAGVNHPAGWSYYGENEETKSISTWYTMQVATPPGPATITSPSGISLATAAVVSFGLLVVGFVAGMVVVRKFAYPKK